MCPLGVVVSAFLLTPFFILDGCEGGNRADILLLLLLVLLDVLLLVCDCDTGVSLTVLPSDTDTDIIAAGEDVVVTTEEGR